MVPSPQPTVLSQFNAVLPVSSPLFFGYRGLGRNGCGVRGLLSWVCLQRVSEEAAARPAACPPHSAVCRVLRVGRQRRRLVLGLSRNLGTKHWPGPPDRLPVFLGGSVWTRRGVRSGFIKRAWVGHSTAFPGSASRLACFLILLGFHWGERDIPEGVAHKAQAPPVPGRGPCSLRMVTQS